MMQQLDLSSAGMLSQQEVTLQTAQPHENVVSQLNIRQRVSGTSDEVNRLMQVENVEVRPECTTEQSAFDAEDKPFVDKLAKDGNLTLTESCGSTGNLSQLHYFDDLNELDDDLNELDEILRNLESTGSSQSIPVSSYEASIADSVFQNEEQKLLMQDPLMSSVVPPAAASPYVTSAEAIDTSCLYSPSPHLISMQSPAALQSPVSPTGVAGALLQQLMIDGVKMAISGSVGPPVQLVHHVPTQVCHSLLLVLSQCCTHFVYLNCMCCFVTVISMVCVVWFGGLALW